MPDLSDVYHHQMIRAVTGTPPDAAKKAYPVTFDILCHRLIESHKAMALLCAKVDESAEHRVFGSECS